MNADVFTQIVELTLKYMSMGGWSSAVSEPTTIIEQLENVMPLFGQMYDNLIGLLTDLFQIVHILDFLPTSWIIIITATIVTIISLRIYAFFKDVEIAGFKI